MMKKLLTLSAVMFVSLSMSADPVDVAKAKQLAALVSVDEPILVSKALRTESKARKLSALAQATSPYYVFSRGEGKGFVIVSGDDCLPDILGYTESGDFDETLLPPHFFGWLDYYKTLVEDAQAAGQNVSRKSSMRKNAPRRIKGLESIPALLTSHWHQTSPYNDRCPIIDNGSRAVTGCVATAAAQVIYYYRKDNPDTYLSTTPTYGADEWHHTAVTDQIKKGTPVMWDLMLDKYSGSEPTEFRQAVANLVFAVGAMDHMDYYTSSGAQISDLVTPMSTFFNLSSTCEYKSDGSSSWVPLATWEKKIYDDLAAGHPIIYTGYKDEETGGHAVVLDGYQSSTGLFHFNFGWGGQGDGWYTVDDETGMNHFNLWQGMTYQICPKKQNVSASISIPDGFYEDRTNEVIVKVKNNSTLNFKGLYLFASTSNSKPTSLSTAKSSDKETVLASGETAEFTLSAKPTNTKAYYLTVTDANLNILAQMEVEPQSLTSNLHLRNLTVAGSNDKETFDGKDFQIIYNDKSAATATFRNASSHAYEGTIRLLFYTYDNETNTWTEVGYKTGKLNVGGNETGETDFNITSTSSCPIEVGKYYYGVLANPVSSSDDVINLSEASDTIIRFILKENDMEVVSFENGCLSIKGHFDATAFNSTSFAKKTAYKTATSYDLTQCTNVTTVKQEVNPNALYYVADNSEATGTNIIKGGKCAQLSLTPGYDFVPRAAFEVEKAQMLIGAESAKWYLLTVPFAATVPEGIIARVITGHTATGISNKTEDLKTLEAGKTYLVMSSSAHNMTLTSAKAFVVTAPVENQDPSLVGTYVATVTPAGASLLDDEADQYFVPMEEGTAVEALRGYWCADDLQKTFRAYSSITLDPAYLVLAQSIETAYGILRRYKNITTADAYKAYLAEIKEAEKEFSNRAESELTSSNKVKKYAEQLLADGSAYSKQVARAAGVEIDFTDCITNPSFETKTTKGWTLGTKEGQSSVGSVYNGTAANTNYSVGIDGTYFFQSLMTAADSSSVSISQEVEGLTPGYYRLTAMVGTDADATVMMFAGDATATVNGHAYGHYYLTEVGIDSIRVEAVEEGETGVLNIGIKEGRWYKVDDFRLTYIASLLPPEDEPDAITVVIETPPVKRGIYTLQGVKVSQMTRPGIYIVDGKKVFHRK
ncbi:MAG: C10 family peptidase [Bacteroidaceae bacterium]|nr:C10 family peptidase [Bacteroidaceae bacterium]